MTSGALRCLSVLASGSLQRLALVLALICGIIQSNEAHAFGIVSASQSRHVLVADLIGVAQISNDVSPSIAPRPHTEVLPFHPAGRGRFDIDTHTQPPGIERAISPNAGRLIRRPLRKPLKQNVAFVVPLTVSIGGDR